MLCLAVELSDSALAIYADPAEASAFSVDNKSNAFDVTYIGAVEPSA